MWKCVLGYGNTHLWLCKNTGAMNRSPTPGGMFTTNFVGVRECFVEYSQPISWANATNSRNVRCGIPIRATHYYNICNTSSQTVRNIIVTRPQLVYFVIVTHSENKNPLFARQKGGFCSVKKAGLHNKNEQPEKPLPVATVPNTHTPPHNNTTHSAHVYA